MEWGWKSPCNCVALPDTACSHILWYPSSNPPSTQLPLSWVSLTVVTHFCAFAQTTPNLHTAPFLLSLCHLFHFLGTVQVHQLVDICLASPIPVPLALLLFIQSLYQRQLCSLSAWLSSRQIPEWEPQRCTDLWLYSTLASWDGRWCVPWYVCVKWDWNMNIAWPCAQSHAAFLPFFSPQFASSFFFLTTK